MNTSKTDMNISPPKDLDNKSSIMKKIKTVLCVTVLITMIVLISIYFPQVLIPIGIMTGIALVVTPIIILIGLQIRGQLFVI
jgi:archaellum biogenesis protein FlaJ (TadC family)